MATVPKRLLRVLLAGGILATGWLAVDLITSSEPAAAADIRPVDTLAETVSTVIDPVVDPVAPVLTPVVQTVADIADPVVAPVASTLDPVTAPVVSSVIAPLAPVIQTVTEPLAPVAHALLDPLAPVVAPLLPVVGEVLGVQPVTSLLTAVPVEALAVASGAGLGAVTAASTGFVALFSGEPGGTPLQSPASPAAAFSVPLTGVAVLLFGVIAALGAALSARPGARLRPLAPVFASDTTPD